MIKLLKNASLSHATWGDEKNYKSTRSYSEIPTLVILQLDKTRINTTTRTSTTTTEPEQMTTYVVLANLNFHK